MPFSQTFKYVSSLIVYLGRASEIQFTFWLLLILVFLWCLCIFLLDEYFGFYFWFPLWFLGRCGGFLCMAGSSLGNPDRCGHWEFQIKCVPRYQELEMWMDQEGSSQKHPQEAGRQGVLIEEIVYLFHFFGFCICIIYMCWCTAANDTCGGQRTTCEKSVFPFHLTVLQGQTQIIRLGNM